MREPILLIEIAGLIFGLVYILCAYRKANYSWISGIISALCIIIVDIEKTHLYFDAILHVFFMGMSFLGLYLWSKGASAKKEIRISKMPLLNYSTYIIVSIIISAVAGYLMDINTDARYPYLDCFQLMMSVFATFLIIYCVVNAWSYWIIVDLISITLYVLTGAYALALLYLAYLISNGLKWKDWSTRYQAQRASRNFARG